MSLPVSTSFGRLTIRHPSSWRAYDEPDGEGEFLTNEQIDPRCRIDSQVSPAAVRCPGYVASLDRLGAGGVEVDLGAQVGTATGRTKHGTDLDGYRASIDTGHSAAVECILGGTGSGITVDASWPTDAVQPSTLNLYACFGRRAATARHQFLAILKTVSVRTRPSESAPVTGARPCAQRTLHVAYSDERGPGYSQTFAYHFTVTNTARRACTVRGYPGVHFTLADGQRLPVHDQDVKPYEGPSRVLYLRPGSRATAVVVVNDCQDPAPFVLPVRASVSLRGPTHPFTVHLPAASADDTGFCRAATSDEPTPIAVFNLVGY